jgi:hypothetical protein
MHTVADIRSQNIGLHIVDECIGPLYVIKVSRHNASSSHSKTNKKLLRLYTALQDLISLTLYTLQRVMYAQQVRAG